MFVKELVISGINKQHHLLDELIGELEGRPVFNMEDRFFCEERTGRIARNLKELRKIKDRYTSYLESMVNLE